MSLYSASGARPPASPTPSALAQLAGRAGPVAPASGKLAAPLPVVDPVAFKDDIVSLSRQGIQARSELSVSTSDAAQNLIGNLAKTMFGELTSTSAVAYNMGSYQARQLEPGADKCTEHESARRDDPERDDRHAGGLPRGRRRQRAAHPTSQRDQWSRCAGVRSALASAA